MTPAELRAAALELVLHERGVREPCPDCQGLGTALYGNTSTWRKGIGGCAMTVGVCDMCWGSGDATRHWPSHREFEMLKNDASYGSSRP